MECDEIKDILSAGDEEFRRLLDFLYQPDSPYSRVAKGFWLKYSNEKVRRLFPDWRDLFWEAFNQFADRVTKDQARERLKNLEETIGKIEDEHVRKAVEEEIEAASKRKWKGPVRDCFQYFKSCCFYLCLGAMNDKLEQLPDGVLQLKDNNHYSELKWLAMEDAFNKISNTCRKLLIARFYYRITDVNVLSVITNGSVGPGSIGATITKCKERLKAFVAGMDLDDFE